MFLSVSLFSKVRHEYIPCSIRALGTLFALGPCALIIAAADYAIGVCIFIRRDPTPQPLALASSGTLGSDFVSFSLERTKLWLDGDKLPDWEYTPVVVKLPVPGSMASFLRFPENGRTAVVQCNHVDPHMNVGRGVDSSRELMALLVCAELMPHPWMGMCVALR